MQGLRKATRVAAISVLGTALVVAGIVLMPLPGPGLAIVVAGLAVFASEFLWARRLLHRLRVMIRRQFRRGTRHQEPLPDHHDAASSMAHTPSDGGGARRVA